MKELIFVTATLGGGGAERVFVNLANELASRGFPTRFLVTSLQPTQSYPVHPAVVIDQIISTKSNKALRIAEKWIQFRKYMKAHEGSTIISFLPDVSMYCVFASLGIRNRHVVSERNDPNHLPESKFMKKMRNAAFALADACVFQTKDAQQYFSSSIQKKSRIICNPLNTALLPEPAKMEERQKTILAVGRIEPQKNFMMLVKAWASIEQLFPDYTLQIYGDKTRQNGIFSKEIEDYLKEHNLQNRVSLMGFSSDIYNVMNQASLYVSSSNFEGISNTILEALAMGLPTVATDCPIGGTRMVIRNGENGILVPVGDAKKMADAIKALLSDPAKMQALSSAAVEVREKLSLPQICDEWLKVL